MYPESCNIVFLGPAHPYRGGIASFTERLARQFNDAGHQTMLCTFRLQYPSFLFPGKTQYTSASAPADLNIRRWVNTLNPINWIITGLRLKALKPDFIIVRYWMPFMAPSFGTILSIVRTNRHTRIICIADNIIPHEKRAGDRWLTRYFTQKVDAFMVMSDQVSNDLQSLGIKKPWFYHAHPLFDHFGEIMDQQKARMSLGLPIDKPILLFFGLIRAYKGLDLLIKAMHDSRVKDTGAILLIAGECYENKQKYLDLIEGLGLKDSIILHDRFIPDEEIRLYFSAADVLVQPYKTATQSGVTPLSMHFELPMIVTRAGGLKEMVTDMKTGVVTEINKDAIADGIIRYLEKGKQFFLPALIKQKSSYSWNGFMQSILDVYKSLRQDQKISK